MSRMSDRERTSWHEAGHAVVGAALGLLVERVELDDGAGGGVCHALEPSSLSLRSEFAYLLAGRLAVALAEEDDPTAARWWQVSPANTLELECGRTSGRGTGKRYRDWLSIVRERHGSTFDDAEAWLKDELEAAKKYAATLLGEHWGAVAHLAQMLSAQGEVDLRGWRLGGAPRARVSTSELKRQSRESLNGSRVQLGLPPRKPAGLTRLSRDEPRVVAILERLRRGGAPGRVLERRSELEQNNKEIYL